MLGGIYSQQKCAICGAGMRDNGRNGVVCPNHPDQRANKLIVRFGRKVYLRFTNYDEASRALTGLRFKTDEGSFDERDYRRDNPLGFRTLAEQYVEVKSKSELKPDTMNHIRQHLNMASELFGLTNIKEIGYGQIEDFLIGVENISSKTRYNIKSNLHAFFRWLVKRRVLRPEQMPEFPEVQFELGWRKTIEMTTQDAILEEIRKLTQDNPRIYIAIKWLATYINVRPIELLGIKEEDVDLSAGLVVVRKHKTAKAIKKPKFIPLIPEDVELIKSLVKGFPKMPFFRRDKGGGGRRQNASFGRHILYRCWKRACENLGVEGIDLYGGTRHSSATGLRKVLTREGVKELSGHETNKAFERYFQVDLDDLRGGYAKTRERENGAVLEMQKG
jgi:integrase